MKRTLFLLAAGLLIAIAPAGAAEHPATADKDGDGKPDVWYQYDKAGHLKRSASDSNHDGKPDQFKEMIKGRNVVLREYDRNFDGKIDRRAMTEWDPDKKLQTFVNGRMQRTPMPGYVTLWSEEDNDYDGKIDVYRERGNKNPPKDKIGKPIAVETKK